MLSTFNTLQDWLDDIRGHLVENIVYMVIPSVGEMLEFTIRGTEYTITKHETYHKQLNTYSLEDSNTKMTFLQTGNHKDGYFDEIEHLYNNIYIMHLAQIGNLIGSNAFDLDVSWEGYYTPKPCKTPVCSCGAKHTSNPKFHLSYCDIKGS